MRINLITSLSGFPYGTANAKRISLIGKSILASGHKFRVFTNSIQFNEFNNNVAGNYEGIFYEYLHNKQIKRNLSKSQKIFYFILGCKKLFGMFRQFSTTNEIVYSYNHGNFFNLYIILLCKIFDIKLVQEINEWYHNDLNRKLEKFIIEGPLVKQSSAAIVISETIKKRVSEINPKLKVLKIPVLEDFTRTSNIDTKNVIGKRYCFWMGDVDGYKNDVFFILKACAQVYSKGIQMYFYVCGPCSIETLSQIKELASQLKYPILQLKILGYLSEEELNTYCNNASLFVVPLWDDERSKSRFPTKIGSFMKTGKPVISCKIGEISNLLSDNHTVLYYHVADYNDLAVKIERLSNDNELYERLSKESYDFASKYFNYLSYSEDLRLFFNNI